MGEPVTQTGVGTGTVHARTLVARAPTEELRAHAPYLIVLVDADEGFRLMAHGDPDAADRRPRARDASPISPGKRFRISRRLNRQSAGIRSVDTEDTEEEQESAQRDRN